MNQNNSSKLPILISIGLIILLGFVVYANSFNNEFIWDDNFLIRDNVYIKDASHLLDIFYKDIGAGSESKFGSYRPIQIATYAIDYSIWGLNQKGYHLTNIILHIVTALMLFWLINILFKNQMLSFVAALLFVIHPIHTEAVTYISGRADSLALLFMLLSFIFYVKENAPKKAVYLVLALVSYALALLSRENAIILPVLLLLYHFSFKKRILISRFLPVALISFAYILLRFTLLKSLLSYLVCKATLLERFPGVFVALFNYIKLMILPIGLHMEYGNEVFDFYNPKAIAGGIILVLLLYSVFRNRKGGNLIFFSIMWFLITLIPVSNLYPINAYMAEHWLYVPSIGFFVLAAAGLCALYKIKKFSRAILICFCGMVIFYSYLTIMQNKYWKDPLYFYERILKYSPNSARVYNNLGNRYKEIGDAEKAIASYKKALELDPGYLLSYSNLGLILSQQGNNKEAIAWFEMAIKLKPDNVKAFNNLGNTYSKEGDFESAIFAYKKALDLSPYDAQVYMNLGNAYNEINKTKEAIEMYKETINLAPNSSKAYINLADGYYRNGIVAESIDYYKQALKLDPENAIIYNNLGNIYREIGKKKEALELLKKSVAIESDNPIFYNNLGNAYKDIGQRDEALKMFKRAIVLNPTYAEAYYNLGNEYFLAGKKPEALRCYMKSIESDRANKAAYNNLAVLYIDMSDYKSAIEMCKKVIEIDPGDAKAYNNLAIAYLKAGENDLAKENLAKAVELGYKVRADFLKILEENKK